MKVYTILCSIVIAGAMPTAKEDGVLEKFTSSLRECLETDTMLCLKEKVLKYTDNLALSKELTVADGITFSRTGSPRSARSYEPLSEEPKAREVQLEDRILDNVADFFDNHVLQLRMPKVFEEEEDNSVDGEGRGKKKKKLKKLLPIFALLKFKLIALIPLFLGIIAFSLFKGLILGKIAFMATAFSTLRKLMDKKGGTSGWAETSQVDHGWDNSAGWGRSLDAQDLAYSSHIKQD